MPVDNIMLNLCDPNIKLINFKRFGDNRGYFEEIYKYSEMQDIPDMLQWNISESNRGVLRGMHFQWNPHMGKLVRCLKGRIIDVIVDIMRNSPRFGEFYVYELDCKRGASLWVPPGYAHGFLAMDHSIVLYGCSGQYSGSDNESAIRWDSFGFDWNLMDIKGVDFIISEKDKNAMTLNDWVNCKYIKEFSYQEMYGENNG